MSDGIDLGKQAGPLPVGGWIIVVAGGLGIAYFINRGQAESATQQPLVDPGVGTGLIPAGAGFQPEEGGQEPEQTNQQWGVQALNHLIGQGHDPATSDNAVRKYLSGEDLTLTENSLINLAILALGAPPDPLPPVNVPEPGGQIADDPQVSAIQISPSNRVRRGTRITLRSKITLNGKPPPQPALVQVTVYFINSDSRVLSRYFHLTDDQGNFETQPKWDDTRGTRRYDLQWRGARKSRRIHYT